MFVINWGELDSRLDVTYYVGGKSQFKHKLKEFVDVCGGKRIPKGLNFSNKKTNFRYLKVENIKENFIRYQDVQYIDKDIFDTLKKYRIVTGELIISIAGTIGKTAIFSPSDSCEYILTENCAKFIFKSTDITPQFLNIILQTKFLVGQMERNYIQTTIPKLGLGRILDLKIPCPSIKIQQQIIDIMDAAYAEKQQKAKEAQDLLDSINGYLLGELGIAMPQEEENTIESRKFYANSADVLGGRFDPFYYKPIFDKYDEALNNGKYTVRKLGKYINYITYGASVDNSYQKTGIPLLRIKDLSPNEINSDDIVYLSLEMEKELRTSRVNLDDLLITRSGTIGVCSVVDKKHSGFAFGSFMIKFKLSCVNPQYVSYYVNSIIGQKYFGRNKIGAIQGNITIPTIKLLPIPIPDPDIQTQIVEKINFIRNKAKQLEQEADDAVKSAKAQVEKILLDGSL